MANWKFTDQYGSAYPSLENSILNLLVFEVPEGTSPVSGTSFSAPLNLSATGLAMSMLARLIELDSVPFEGTVEAGAENLTVTLRSSDDGALTSAIATTLPLIGGQTQDVWIVIENETPTGETEDEVPTKDEFNLDIEITVGSGTGRLHCQVPMSEGMFMIEAQFEGLGIQLSDLDFLVNGGDFGPMFPNTLPPSYYTEGQTALELLSIGLSFFVYADPDIPVDVGSVSVSIGIVNIPLLPNALFLSPLSCWITITDPMGTPVPTWGLDGVISLYPYGKQTNPPTTDPDFLFLFDMELPTTTNPSFYLTGQYQNPANQSVAVIISDLLNDGDFNTGISSDITLTDFEFSTEANTQSGTISGFSTTIGMSAAIGVFGNADFGIKDFSISVDYVE